MHLARNEVRASRGVRRKLSAAPPGWHPRLLRTAENSECIDWLRDRGSLTARLEACGQFAVERLCQRQARPLQDERAWLGRQGGMVRQREVLLRLDGVAVVFAHTIMPLRPRGVLTQWFQRLGSRSLGRLLFAHPGFMRGVIEVRRLDARHPLYRRAAAALAIAPGTCWARRSTFYFGRQQVLVTEVFVPQRLPAAVSAPR